MARLPCIHNEDRAVGVGKIINATITRAVDIGVGGIACAHQPTTIQGEVAARGGLADVGKPLQNRNTPENRMIVTRLMCVTPTPALDSVAVFLAKLQERVVKRGSRDIGAGLDWG